MIFIDNYSKPAVASIDKETKSLNTDSERTTPLEEDEKMCEDADLISKNEPTEEFVSCSPARATRVQFAPMASLYLTISLDEYTQEEIEDSFWTPKQWNSLNKARKRTVERMEAGLEEKRSTPYRGLENATIWGYRRSLKAKNAYFNTVMDEMAEKHWMENKNELWDWEKIASLTEETTKKCAQEAIEIALSDENEAKAIYESLKEKQKLGKCVSNMSAFFRLVKSGL